MLGVNLIEDDADGFTDGEGGSGAGEGAGGGMDGVDDDGITFLMSGDEPFPFVVDIEITRHLAAAGSCFIEGEFTGGGMHAESGDAVVAAVGSVDPFAGRMDGDVAGGGAVRWALIDEGELAGGGIDVPAADGAAWVLGGAVFINGDEEFPVRGQGEEAGAGGGAGEYGRPEGPGFRVPIGPVNALAGRTVVGAEIDAGFRRGCAGGGDGEQGASGGDGGDRDGGKP